MTLTTNAIRVLDALIQSREGEVYSVLALDLYKAYRLDKTDLIHAIHCLLQHDYRITTFSTQRDIRRIQTNADDSKINKYISQKGIAK